MAEYTRDNEEHQIYRDLANRLGRVAAQYQELKKILNDQENYDATLTISLLHPLLAIYTEMRKRHSRISFTEFDRPLCDIPDSYGIRLSMVKTFTCYDECARKEDVTFDFVLESIRHALSHPCPILDEQHQRTGYETVVGQRGFIEKFRFIQSSDVFGNNGRPRSYRQDEAKRILDNIFALNPNHGISMQPTPARNGNTYYHLVDSSGSRFVRKIVIEVPLDALKTLVMGLSEYLGRPVEEMMTQQFNGPRVVRARR
jgi:hypothetical protein